MARYRKGDRYLSEEEYREEQKNGFIFFLFLLGAVVSGYLVHSGVADFDFPKWARFTIVTVSALFGGSILALLHKQVEILLGIALLGGIVFVVIGVIWEIV